MVRKDLIGKEQAICPVVFSYKEMIGNNSLYNTPPVYSIYITNLVLKWIKEQGGVTGIYERNLRKSNLIYSIIDDSKGFYKCVVDPKFRSIMNVCFRIGGNDEALEAEFLAGAQKRHMISLKGHRFVPFLYSDSTQLSRSVGGIRASLYNAVSEEETETLASWMREFQASKQ